MTEASKPSTRKKAMIVFIVIAVAVIAISAVFLTSYYNLTAVRETWAVAYHNSTGETNYYNNTYSFGSLSGAQFHFGNQMVVEAYRTWQGGGTVTLTNVTCNTMSFSIENFNHTLPWEIPIYPGLKSSPFSFKITFGMPPPLYTGPLEYTLFFDYYP